MDRGAFAADGGASRPRGEGRSGGSRARDRRSGGELPADPPNACPPPAGNPVILKPSPRTPMTADLLARAVEKSGWPRKAFSLLHADPEPARPLWTDERIRCVSFTGSDAVGWKIKQEASRKKVILELGG